MFGRVQRKSMWNVLTIAILIFSVTATLAAADPGITPSTVVELIYPGESINVNKTVTTPAIPPTPDIYFLADTTGSMGPAIANVQANAATILAAVGGPTTAFGAGDYKDFLGDPYAFNNAVSLAVDGGAAASAAIAAWGASGGGDGSEGQFYALDQLADSAMWRADSTRIIVWFGDAPAHDPVCTALTGFADDITEASVTAKLVAANIRVISISIDTGFYSSGLNDDPQLNAGSYSGTCTIGGTAGQATRISAATGGQSFTGLSPDEVADAILDALTNLPADTAMVSDCTDPISTTFAPASQTVTSGDNALFAETIAVAAGAAGGTYACQDWATVNGEDMVDAGGNLITEDKTIHVPGITLTPETDMNELGFDLDHTVTALVSAGDYGPVEGVRVEFEITAGPQVGETGLGATDSAGEADFIYTPPVAPASLGTDTIEACFTNVAGDVEYGCDTAVKEWVDTTPPIAQCVPTVNPAGKNEPNAPGNGGQGQNQDGFYELLGDDVVWPDEDLEVFVTDDGSGTVWGPFDVGTRIKYTQAPGGKPSQKLIGGSGSAVAWHLTGNGDALVTVVDGSGNVSDAVSCLVPPPPQ